MTLSKMANKINKETDCSSNEDSSDEEMSIETNSSKESENEAEDEDNKSENAENISDKSDAESEDASENSDKDDTIGANAAWADSIAKILKTKKPKNKRTLVLSKAKKLTDVVKKEKPEDVGFQIDGEIKETKLDVEQLTKLIEKSDEPSRKKRKEMPSIRVKPNILDKDREKTLAKIATRGVVQLFNSVRMQQKDIDMKLEEAGPLERKRDNALKSIDKRAFLDVLMQKKSQPVDGNVKDEIKNENKKPTWSVLRDDFMMGAKLKDWDKEMEEDDDNVGEMNDSD